VRRLSRLLWMISAVAATTATVLAILPPAPTPPFENIVLGASLFKAAWAYKNDRPWLERQLEWLRRHRFDAIRAFGTVGDPSRPDYWDGREIDWRWRDYAQIIAGTTDLAYDRFGIRVQWTIFADAQKNTPREADRAALVEEFVRLARGRERKILAFEVANEFWQNGFEGPEGIRQLQRFSERLHKSTSVPVAASAHADPLCAIYAAKAVDFASVHFDRGAPAARWSPLTKPWRVARQAGQLATCELPERASNNEPLGPGSSIPQPLTPLNVVMTAVNTYVAGIPIYMFHTGPGVKDDPTHPQGLRPSELRELPDAERFFGGLAAIKGYLPANIPGWKSITAADEDFPFTVKGKAAVVLAAANDSRFTITLAGVGGSVKLIARKPLEVKRIDPLTGKVVETRRLNLDETLRLRGEAAVLQGNTHPAASTPRGE
jgi:hypothetical protein